MLTSDKLKKIIYKFMNLTQNAIFLNVDFKNKNLHVRITRNKFINNILNYI